MLSILFAFEPDFVLAGVNPGQTKLEVVLAQVGEDHRGAASVDRVRVQTGRLGAVVEILNVADFEELEPVLLGLERILERSGDETPYSGAVASWHLAALEADIDTSRAAPIDIRGSDDAGDDDAKAAFDPLIIEHADPFH